MLLLVVCMHVGGGGGCKHLFCLVGGTVYYICVSGGLRGVRVNTGTIREARRLKEQGPG